VAIIAFAFNAYLQRDQRVGEYQKLLFERRLKVYEDLVASARATRDRSTLAYQTFLGLRRLPKAPDVAWQARLAAASHGIFALTTLDGDGGGDSGGGGDGGGSSGGGRDLPILFEWQASRLVDAIKAMRELELKRTEAALFVSVPVNRQLDQLLETLISDIEDLQRRLNAKGPFKTPISVEDQRAVEAALLRAEQSYEDFLKAVTEALRVKEVILG